MRRMIHENDNFDTLVIVEKIEEDRTMLSGNRVLVQFRDESTSFTQSTDIIMNTKMAYKAVKAIQEMIEQIWPKGL